MTSSGATAGSAAHPVKRRSGLKGFVLGLIVMALIVVTAWGVRSVLAPGRRTFSTTCGGATLTGTIWLDSSVVLASVVVDDSRQRAWDIKWGQYNEEVGGRTLTPGPDQEILATAQVLGDTDDGTHRTAQLRPAGASRWCELKMHVYRFW